MAQSRLGASLNDFDVLAMVISHLTAVARFELLKNFQKYFQNGNVIKRPI